MKKIALSIIALGVFNTANAAPYSHPNLQDNGTGAYAIDKYNDIVRDSFGGCVRTRYWNAEIALASCEGKKEAIVVEVTPEPVEEVQPAPVVEEVVAPVVIAPVETAPTPAEEKPALANFRGLFSTGSAELKPMAQAELDKFADYMHQYPDSNIVITGHTDSMGAAENNQRLSEARAQAVKNYLESKGVDSNRMTAEGAGESKPIADNATKEGRAKNRRVAVELAN